MSDFTKAYVALLREGWKYRNKVRPSAVGEQVTWLSGLMVGTLLGALIVSIAPSGPAGKEIFVTLTVLPAAAILSLFIGFGIGAWTEVRKMDGGANEFVSEIEE